ncbi:hypothetical protein [Neobacillus sp. OS1-33]|uniref:hypothetical protein n=1 Tax=Neobacillus sp. OS1-33 TaxID=3070683 RepID=UPI0027DF00BF|nr:hypothetical protein [Neobacillus sp. OS1-33]WML26274.1 hypothetical protein RCG22_01100 [Neobacillus sp. OS1-33]
MSDYYKQRIKKNSEDTRVTLEKYKKLENLINMQKMKTPNDIRYSISVAVLDKVTKLTKEILDDEKKMMIMLGNLRYIFETLVVSRLLLEEKDYAFKVYFSIQTTQINKLDKIVTRIEKEIQLLNNLIMEEEQYSNDPDNMLTNIEKLDKKLKKEITIFMEDVENHGYSFHKHLVETQILSTYKNKLDEYKSKNLKRAKDLANSQSFNKFFQTNGQSSKVFKLLADGRSWKAKADKVGLTDEYEIVYEMTSSLMHFNSYSLFTSDQLDEGEVFLIYRMLNQYLDHIYYNLVKFCDFILID